MTRGICPAVPATFSLAIGLASIGAPVASEPRIDPMPAELEFRWALSAMPPSLRDAAAVYLLDPGKGYELAREGSSGVTCLVQRTVWEMTDYRDDIYIPLCYDAVGTRTLLRAIMDAAELRAGGVGPEALFAEVAGRFSDGTYAAPETGGISYMVAPLQRTIGPPDMNVVTLSMPHYMPYAPGVSNADIGAAPDPSDPKSLYHPFIDRQGIDAQSYLIHMVGHEERGAILTAERDLLSDLCAYRDLLCEPQTID